MGYNAVTFLSAKYNGVSGQNTASSFLSENHLTSIDEQRRAAAEAAENASKNNGGFFGGIGYSLEKLGLGFLSSIEGIWDYTAGGLAKLFGADDWAEQQFANDWVNYNHADEWFNPSDGWRFVGDVTGGIGTSLPAIAATAAAGAIAVASGGTLTPVAAALISATVAGLGAAGNATKEAYRQTGELGGKEFGYGALVGITEGAVEGISAGIGVGTGQIVKGISKSFGKEVAESAARQTLGKTMIKGFIGEAFEEGLSEILEPVWARLTYDPNAKNATIQEIGYAALVGGLSGAIMGGVDVSIRNVRSMSRGNTIVNQGKSGDVISMSEQLSLFENENHTGYEQFQLVQNTLNELQQSLQKTNGEIRTAKQKMLLGVLEQANTTAAFTPFIARSAENIVNNAEVIAAKLTSYGYTDANGKPIVFTAEQIRSGVDVNNPSTFVNSLKENSILRTLAVADATGRLSMDTAKFKEATLRGEQLSSQVDLNRFIETATDAEKSAVAEKLGISDWNGLTNEEFHAKINEFVYNGGVEAYQQERAGIESLQSLDAADAKKLPRAINMKEDGAVRYSLGEKSIAIVKKGDSYQIYDYESGKLSKTLTRAEVNKTLSEIRKAQAAASETVIQTEQQTEASRQAQEIDAYARENISDYAKLNAANQNLIRGIIRQGRAAGISDADVLSYARVSARTGINVVFDKSLCLVARNKETGEGYYSDGYYDPDTNRFVINPETTRTHEALLIHELTHAIYKTADGKLVIEKGVKNMSASEKEDIIKRYRDAGRGGAIELMDEINAHYAEETLTNKNILDRLLADKPTLKDRILSFFKKAKADYTGDTNLSKTAQSLYNRYKKLFDSFSQRNQQYNTAEYSHTVVSENTRQALPESLKKLGQYSDEEIKSIETSKLFQVARSYEDVKSFVSRSLNTEAERRLFLGKITAETAAMIQAETGKNVDGKSIALSSSDIKHIFKNHGTNGTELLRGQIPVTEANFENIIETLIAPDSVSKLADGHREGVVFNKEIDGRVTAVALISEKKKALTLKSAWITKEKQSTSLTPNAQALNVTSETGQRLKTVSSNSISENAEKVNSKNKKRFALPENNSEGKPLTTEQREFFKDSAIRAKEINGWKNTISPDGALMPVYHGTNSDAFYEFNPDTIGSANDMGWYGKGFYFAFSKSEAASYGRRVMECYLNITKPFFYSEEMKHYDGRKSGDVMYDFASFVLNLSEKFPEIANTIDTIAIESYNAGEPVLKQMTFNELAQEIKAIYDSPRLQVFEARDSNDAVVYKYKFEDGMSEMDISPEMRKLMREKYLYSQFRAEYCLESGEITERQYKNLLSLFNKYGEENFKATYLSGEFTTRESAEYARLSAVVAYLADKKYAHLDMHLPSYYMEDISGDFSAALRERGYDGIVQSRTGDEIIVFESSQIKLTDNTAPTKSKDIRYALPEIEQEAVKKFGHTYKWSETGYILTDGSRLDFSGKNEGAGGGYRTVDHRDISTISSYKNASGTDSLIDFMKRGNIRVIPEYGGINLSVLPTKAQENALSNFISINRGEITLDIDNARGDTVVSVEYPRGTYYTKILQDIRNYFKDGTEPVVSELSKFRYALPAVDSNGTSLTDAQRLYFKDSVILDERGRLLRVYHGTATGTFTVFETELDGAYFTADKKYATEYSRPHQNTGKNQVYECYLNIKNPFDTRNARDRKLFYDEFYQKWGNGADLSQRGLPDWTDGSDLVEFLKERGYDGVIIDEGGVPDGKGGVRDRGISYVAFYSNQIKNTSNANPTGNGDIRYALPSIDSKGGTLSEQQRQFFKDSKVVDEKGRLLVVYHGTRNGQFTIFEQGKGKRNDAGWLGEGFYFSGEQDVASDYAAYGGRIIEAYLDVKNPYYATPKDNERLANLDDVKASRKFSERLKAQGYDGVYYNGDLRQEWVVFEPNQIKLTTNQNPTQNSDIRYALPDDENSRGGLTRGQRAKFVANNTQMRVYSKAEAAEVINSIIDERLVFDDKYGSLSGKSRAEVIETLFRKLNSTKEGYRIGVALNIADYIIENAVLTDMFDSRDTSYSMEILSAMRRYMHGLNLKGIQGEIQYKFDKKNSINLVWGAKTGGISPDVMAQELSANYGIQFEAINEAEQFFEMLEKYEAAKNEVNERVEKVKLSAYGSAEQISKLRQQIARDILNAYDEKGSQSKFGKLVEKYTRQIDSLTEQVRNARKINSVTNSIIDSAQYLRDISSKRKYVGAEVFTAPELTSWLKQLGKLKYRSDLRKTGARQILLDYGKFYNENNPLLYDADPNLSYIDQNVLDALSFIRQNADSKKPLSLEELRAAQVILASAKHLFQNYDQMTMEGKKVRITEIAEQGNAILLQSKNRTGGGIFNSIYGVMNKIVEPRVVIKSLENYNPNGVLTRAYNEITRGETAAGALYIDLVSGVDEYFNTHKKYSKRLSNEYITVAGAELSVGQAISLYELSKREQAREGLYESGFSYLDKKGVKHSVNITESDIATLAKRFTAEDRGFIAVVEEFFNQRSKQVKTDADLEILGYTNTSEDFYFPIKRDSGTIAKNITDARELMADWANVYNFSFNKDVKAGAKNKIFVTDVFSVITRHAKQLSTYAKLTVPLKNFSQIYSKNIGDKTNVKSIRNTLNERVWSGADRYLSKLFSDIQGRATSNSVIEKLRGAYAKYQLGANLKVIVSQFTSYPTAGIILDVSSMTKGAVMKTDYAALDKYCEYARVRNYEKGVVKAEGVIDKVGKVGDILTKPIQWTDRATIGKLWNACQVQVEKDSGLKVGTVENMEKAGVMLEEVVRLTQPNYSNTERSELMRSDSDIVRSFTMFTSVPLKQLSRLVESVGEYKALREMVKSGNADADIQSRYKAAKKKLRRTLGSITVANLMYVMVGQMFKWLYNKDRKDKDGNEISFIQDFFTDFASTTIGMFPVVKDIYNYFANDYEFNNFAYETVNNLLSASKELFELATKAGSGEPMETSDYMKPLRNSLYAIGQITGLPFRNINNTISGLVKRFDPAAAYKYNSMFYNAQYSKDIKEALEKGDTELADTIMGLLLDEDKAGNLNAAARKKLIELYEKEYTVLPRSVGDSVTYNGETIKLTAKQRDRFKSIYGQANQYVERMITSSAFMRLSEEKQAKAIKQLYDAFYDKALAETLGVEAGNKMLTMTKFIQLDTLSPILAGISDLTSDKDASGNTVQNSKKRKVLQYLLQLNLSDAQRLLLLYYSGYTVKDGEYRGWTAARARTVLLRYILNAKGVTATEKASIAEMCNFQVRNGKIVPTSV